MKSRIPKIYLVGAGPGASDLLSIRGLKLLQKAKVVLYDALVNEDLLAEVPPDALKVYVGKRAGQASLKQESCLCNMPLSMGWWFG